MDELSQMEALGRSALPRLHPVAQGRMRAILQQLARLVDLQKGNEGATAPGRLPPRELAELVKQRRLAAGFTQEDLAARSGISIRTVKNLEKARHPPTAETVRRLLAVPELELMALDLLAPVAEDRPNARLLPRYDRQALVAEMRALLNGPGGALDQTFLYLDDQGADAWLALARSPRIQSMFTAIPHEAAAQRIADSMGSAGLDVVALGPGAGQSEVRLCQLLLEATLTRDMRLYLLDISHPLLNIALLHAEAQLPGVEVEVLHGDFRRLAQYPMLLPKPDSPRRRLYTILGCTLSNLDNEAAFWRDQMRLAAPGDFMVFDFQVASSPPKSDPALHAPIRAGNLDISIGPLLRYGRDIADYKVSMELSTACPVPGSYELGISADVRRKNGSEQRYLLFRVRRYQPEGLVRCLEQLGWQQRLLRFYGPGDGCGLLLLERQKGG